MIDTLAGAVALIGTLIPDVAVQGTEIDDTRPIILVRQATAPMHPDLPLVKSRIDVSCYPDPADPAPQDAARDLASRVLDALHRRGLTFVEVGDQTYRMYVALQTDGGQIVRDPASHEDYALDFYELRWGTDPV
jgi:hypothetical protein